MPAYVRVYVHNYLSCFNIFLIHNILHRKRKKKEELQLFETIMILNYQITLLASSRYSMILRFNCCVICFCNDTWGWLFSKHISDVFFMHHYGHNDNSYIDNVSAKVRVQSRIPSLSRWDCALLFTR